MTTEAESIKWLMQLFASLCDGEWERDHGFDISTVSNPGWKIELDLRDSIYEKLTFEAEFVDAESDDTWVIVSCAAGQMRGSCAPLQLAGLVNLIREKLATAQA
jgi:hypothetical protein